MKRHLEIHSSRSCPSRASGTVAMTRAPGTNLGYVDGLAVLSSTAGYATADSTWRNEAQGYQNEILRMSSKLDSAQTQFDETSVAMSNANKIARRKQLDSMSGALQQRQQDLQGKLDTRKRELLQPIQERIQAVMDGIRAEGQYAFIFDVSASGGGFVVAADKGNDLTQKAIDRLKAPAPKKP